MDEDLLEFLDAAPAAVPGAALPEPWRILIVDDDPDVHELSLIHI